MRSPESPYPTPLEVSARAFDALNRHDLDGLRALLARDVVAHVVPVGVYDGLHAVLAFHAAMFAAAPDLHVEVTHIAAAGEAVLVAWELSATFTGAPFQGLRPNGRHVTIEGTSTHVVRDGRLVSAQVIYDGASFARQVGLLPIRGSVADRAIVAAVNLRTRLHARRGKTPGEVHEPPRQRSTVGPEELRDLLRREELAVIATDLAGLVTHWSAGAERLYGWSTTEVLGRPITELTVGPEDGEVAESIMQCVRESGRWEGEFWVRRKDGTAFLAYVREAIVSDEHGTPIGLVGVSVEAFVNGIDAPSG